MSLHSTCCLTMLGETAGNHTTRHEYAEPEPLHDSALWESPVRSCAWGHMFRSLLKWSICWSAAWSEKGPSLLHTQTLRSCHQPCQQGLYTQSSCIACGSGLRVEHHRGGEHPAAGDALPCWQPPSRRHTWGEDPAISGYLRLTLPLVNGQAS